MTKKKKLTIILILLLIILFALLAVSGYYIISWKIDNDKIKAIVKEFDNIPVVNVPEEKTQIINPPKEEEQISDYWYYVGLPLTEVDLTDLKKENSDTVGFLSVGGTNINYPIVQAKNNDYYLNHSFKKEYNDAGWIYADYRNNMNTLDQNTIIYGHSRLDKSLFGTLRNILKTSWTDKKENYVIRMSTLNGNSLWQVFSVYKIKEESYYITPKFSTDVEYETWLGTMLKRSEFNFNTTINVKDKVLTLSTCYDTDGNRVVMHAKLIKTS